MPQYSGVWNLAQQAQALTRQQWVTDPVFDYTTLLLQADNAANGAQNNTFLDSSTNAFAITRNGNTTQGTFSPFSLQPGEWGANFTGGNNSLVALSSPPLPSTGQFNFECWFFTNSLSADQVIFSQYTATDSGRWAISINTAGKVAMGGNTLPNLATTSTVTVGTWNHVAISRDASNVGRIFFNGVLENTLTGWSSGLHTGNPRISGFDNPSQLCFNGYLSNMRIMNVALYTASFTVPSSPLTAISGTTFLGLQNNRYRDNSSNNITLTPTGTSIQAFSPFAPQYQYTPTVTGGSGYFDGTGDFLATPSNTAFTVGTGAFTLEAWVYPIGSLASGAMFISGTNTNDLQFGHYTANQFGIATLGTAWLITSSTALTINAWNHCVCVRSGTGTNQTSLFLNGARVANGTVATNFTNTQVANTGATFTGYISNPRFVKGTAVYDPTQTTITVPTAPLTAVTNTSLLLNFTNAGILDGTMKNNLETVGNAQVSTSVVKYGSGSLAFDGTGDDLQTFANNPDLRLSTGDFTVEGWAYQTTRGAVRGLFQLGETAGGLTADPAKGLSLLANSDGRIAVYAAGSASTYFATSTVLPLNIWYHFAIVRANGITRFYLNGSLVTDIFTNGALTDIFNYQTPYVAVGGSYAIANVFAGYMDDFRITKGIARYTRNFTPPQVALPRQ